MDITELLAFSVKNKASDLHLSSGLPPMIRVHGDVRRINLPPMEHKDVHSMVYDIMNDAQRKTYEETLELAAHGAADARGEDPDRPLSATQVLDAEARRRDTAGVLVTDSGDGGERLARYLIDEVL